MFRIKHDSGVDIYEDRQDTHAVEYSLPSREEMEEVLKSLWKADRVFSQISRAAYDLETKLKWHKLIKSLDEPTKAIRIISALWNG